MGRLALVTRLAVRDLRRRRVEALLLMVALTAASATLTLGLVLHGITAGPYQSTRAATAGPDVVAQVDPPSADPAARAGSRASSPADLAALEALIRAPGVTGHSGPYPIAQATLRAHAHTADVQAEGRDVAAASIDRPKLTDGSWVRDGRVVVERGFAEAFDLHAGDSIALNGRSFRVAGIAVTAAVAPYASATTYLNGHAAHPSLIWVTRRDARSLAGHASLLSYVLNLKLEHPAAAQAFVQAHSAFSPEGQALQPPMLQSWQELRAQAADLVRNEQRALLTGSWLLALLGLASLVVLVGGRMADQIRRVGLLKAVGATPSLIAVAMLLQYLLLALLAAAAGLAAGRLAAPVLARPGASLIGSPDGVPFTIMTAVVVTVVVLVVAVLATVVPIVRTARMSTVLALADSARAPRRAARLISLSARLPVPLLLGLRVASRRPRRTLLGIVTIAVTVSGIVAALAGRAHLHANQATGSSGLDDPRTDRLSHMLLLITVMLIAQAAVNAIFITWATVLDTRRSSALARALGATPQQVSAGLSAAQVLPALAGAVLGIPGGIGLVAAVSPGGVTVPSLWSLLATVLAAPLAIAALTAIPARASARRSVAQILHAELS